MRQLLRIPILLHRAALRAMKHDVLNLAQSSAYSAIVALFPTLIIAAAVIALLPDTAPVRSQLGAFFDRVLPPEVIPILGSYFTAAPHKSKSARVVLLSLLVSVTGGSSVIATYMEGFRRAHNLPSDCWTFWGRRARAYALVPLSLVPLAIASSLIVFGHLITLWLALHVMPSVRTEVYIMAIFFRWLIALTGSVGLIALIYHMGTPIRQPWHRVLPGAIAATAMWFVTTLVFGWYVTRFANYSQVYGSLGAGIALLFWLYIVSLSVLFGAEFNAVFLAGESADVAS
ncbi:YihY/virulence factor BrkB family protein [Edaphobacter albus]|uniref:YihY/virulence factor BrkB family protein n=1 Tax=Edaphobacter sp. 4G125 TaxID=2763071 RepID=UPI0021051CF5|nr:YihY/virulence factor BrkB family protein [Edaphobacter sp. 4G125]